MRLGGLGLATIGAMVLGALSTLADFLWATVIPGHRVVYGLAHGMLLLACIGLWLGMSSGRLVAGAVGGVAIGFISAAGFYALAPILGYSAMFPMWMLLWVLFAYLHAFLLGAADAAGATWRGLLAGVSSGLAFYAISGIWLDPAPGGPNYAWHLAAWTCAFLPGFLALMATRGRSGAHDLPRV